MLFFFRDPICIMRALLSEYILFRLEKTLGEQYDLNVSSTSLFAEII
jgi:hypothetical protein